MQTELDKITQMAMKATQATRAIRMKLQTVEASIRAMERARRKPTPEMLQEKARLQKELRKAHADGEKLLSDAAKEINRMTGMELEFKCK